MASRVASALAARGSPILCAATTRTTTGALGRSVRHVTVLLQTGHINARDFSRAHAITSDSAVAMVRQAEMNAWREYTSLRHQRVFQNRVMGLSGSKACSLIRKKLDEPAPSIRMTALRSCQMLLRQRKDEDSKAKMVGCLTAAGIVPCLVRELSHSEDAVMQLEAVGVLAAIATAGGTHVEAVISSGGIHELVRLAESEHQALCEQASLVLRCIERDAASGHARGL